MRNMTMRNMLSNRLAWAALVGLMASLPAEAERIMYNGFCSSAAVSTDRFSGFTEDANVALLPSASSYLVRSSGTDDILTLPTCFANVPTILPVQGTAGTDGALRYFFPSSQNAGAKVLTLSKNCQDKKGELHFRFLFRADQTAIDGMPETSLDVPNRQYVESCGILWSTFDYGHACAINSNVRYVQDQFAIGTDPGEVKDNTANITFSRGFLVGLVKDSWTHKCELRLHVWGKNATDYVNDCKMMVLESDVSGDKTYLCHVRIEIDHYANGDDRLVGFVQPVDGYDTSCGWTGAPFVSSLRADVIGSNGQDLYGHLTFQGFTKMNKGYIRFDEMGLATAAADLSLITFNDEKFTDLLAYDGLPCGPGDGYPGYPTAADTKLKNVTAASVTTNVITGFQSFWTQAISKDVIVSKGDGTGLAIPACYAEHGVLGCAGTSIGYSSKTDQGLYVRRALNNNLLALKTGDVLHLRCLLAATSIALGNLSAGPDAQGGLIAGTVGVTGNVNYFGAGVGDCSVAIESGNSHAPTLCRRARSCFFTFTKGSDSKVGLYLNLLTEADGTPVAYKLRDVDAAKFNGTVLCYARIEVGTGANGKERITAFAQDVTKITGQYDVGWVPSAPGQFIEHELIGDSDYPKHVMGGGKAHTGFQFDEVGLELGKKSKYLVWAKRMRGLMVVVR